MRIPRIAHDNGDVSLRLTPEHADALLGLLIWKDPEQGVARGNHSSFDSTKLVDIKAALEREGRQAFPSELSDHQMLGSGNR